MTRLRVMFMGASRLVGLLERFAAAAEAEGVGLDLLSLEGPEPWHAIDAAGLARVVAAPRFDARDFEPWLLDMVRREGVDVLVPTVDGAVAALAGSRAALTTAGAMVVVSEPPLCLAMNDKHAAEVMFRERGLPTPDPEAWPRLAKPRFGSAGKGHEVLHGPEELALWRRRCDPTGYQLQGLVRGPEYSVDAFVAPGGRPLGAVARRRVQVSGGEVMVGLTERQPDVLALAERILAWPGWFGPINIQVILTADGPVLIEVNPRFSSGYTLAIEAGLDAPRWLLRLRLGRDLPEAPPDWRPGLYLTRYRKDLFRWSS